MKLISNHVIVEDLISENKRIQKKALLKIYDYCKPRLKALFNDSDLYFFETEDIIQDTIAIVYQNIKNQSFKQNSSVLTYSFSVAKKLFLYKQREELKRIKQDIDSEENLKLENDPIIIRKQLLSDVMNNLGSSCKGVLQDFYFHKLSMEEIAINYNLDNAQIAKNKKWRCMKKLIQLVKSKRLKLEDFYNEH